MLHDNLIKFIYYIMIISSEGEKGEEEPEADQTNRDFELE